MNQNAASSLIPNQPLDSSYSLALVVRMTGGIYLREILKVYYTYIMASPGGTLYTGVTNDILNRVFTHKQRIIPGFSQRYNVTRLFYFEVSREIHSAIAREKQIKGWKRCKKIALIESLNPKWMDLAADWYSSDDMN